MMLTDYHCLQNTCCKRKMSGMVLTQKFKFDKSFNYTDFNKIKHEF